uniref:Uncharacterized protein n=1 Tax=Rhizophora mucronata TaxID=61149 RepID=A0A2P2P868_RHIMU
MWIAQVCELWRRMISVCLRFEFTVSASLC